MTEVEWQQRIVEVEHRPGWNAKGGGLAADANLGAWYGIVMLRQHGWGAGVHASGQRRRAVAERQGFRTAAEAQAWCEQQARALTPQLLPGVEG